MRFAGYGIVAFWAQIFNPTRYRPHTTPPPAGNASNRRLSSGRVPISGNLHSPLRFPYLARCRRNPGAAWVRHNGRARQIDDQIHVIHRHCAEMHGVAQYQCAGNASLILEANLDWPDLGHCLPTVFVLLKATRFQPTAGTGPASRAYSSSGDASPAWICSQFIRNTESSRWMKRLATCFFRSFFAPCPNNK
jgi:hypothetical protein